jgi:hypothetical protein
MNERKEEGGMIERARLHRPAVRSWSLLRPHPHPQYVYLFEVAGSAWHLRLGGVRSAWEPPFLTPFFFSNPIAPLWVRSMGGKR